MKPVAIFRHLECEGPGYFAEFLARNGLTHQLIRIDQQDPAPDNITNFSALVFMGGPMSVNDNLPWIPQELNLIKQAVSCNMPVLGHCLGGQLIAKALGARITTNPVKEIGWHDVQRNNNPEAIDWLDNLPTHFEVFHWHGETFSIPDGASPLLSSQYCQNQAFTSGNTLALQCHVEMTASMVREWVTQYSHELVDQSESLQSGDEILENLDNRIQQLQPVADHLYGRWIQALVN